MKESARPWQTSTSTHHSPRQSHTSAHHCFPHRPHPQPPRAKKPPRLPSETSTSLHEASERPPPHKHPNEQDRPETLASPVLSQLRKQQPDSNHHTTPRA